MLTNRFQGRERQIDTSQSTSRLDSCSATRHAGRSATRYCGGSRPLPRAERCRIEVSNRLPSRAKSAVQGRHRFRRQRVCIFIDGCFWHRCPKHFHVPKTNSAWWDEKVQATVDRDQRQTLVLRQSGWNVLRFWEHDLRIDTVASVVKLIRGTLRRLVCGKPAGRVKDRQRTLGMFFGNELMKEIDAAGQKLREQDRQRARRRGTKRRRTGK